MRPARPYDREVQRIHSVRRILDEIELDLSEAPSSRRLMQALSNIDEAERLLSGAATMLRTQAANDAIEEVRGEDE